MEGIILDYFSNIFTTNGPTNFSATIDAVQPMDIVEMISSLTQVFQVDEVHRALKHMHSKKSPSPNGMPPLSTSIFGLYLVSVLRLLF